MLLYMKKNKNGCDLKSCFLCRHCLPEWIPAIESHRKNFHFKKGESVFSEGDLATGIYFVYNGKVKVHKKWGPEKELIIRFAAAGSLFGHRGLGMTITFPFPPQRLSRRISVLSIWNSFGRALERISISSMSSCSFSPMNCRIRKEKCATSPICRSKDGSPRLCWR